MPKSVCYVKRTRLDENVGETLHDWKRQHTHCSMLGCICQVLNVTERLDGCGSATAEHTFSVIRQVKSWLRSTMSSNTLNNRLFSTIHKQRIDEVSALDVAKEFVEVNEQRRMYFGHYDWQMNEQACTDVHVSVTSTTVSPSHNYNDNYTQDIHCSLLDGIYCYLLLFDTFWSFYYSTTFSYFYGSKYRSFHLLASLSAIVFLFSFVMQRIILSLCGCNWNK